MGLKKYKRGEYWWISGTVHGQTIRESTKTDNPEAAETIRIKRESQLVSDHLYGAKATRTFAQAVESYLEAGGDNRFIGSEEKGLLAFFFGDKLSDIKQNDLQKAAKKLYPTAQPETINRQLFTPFIAVWNHAVKNDWAEMRMWQRPRKVKGTMAGRDKPTRSGTTPVEYEHAAKFVAAMSPAPAMVMTALFYTGMRPIELFSLSANDVDVDKQWISLNKSKTGEPRGIPIHDFLVKLFSSLCEHDGILFRTHKGEPYELIEGAGGQIKGAVKGARKRTGIKDVSPYTGRHTVSTQLVVNGIHPHVKDQILGHAVDSMSRHYTHVPQAPLIEAINTLPVPDVWRDLEWWVDPVAFRSRFVKWGSMR